MNKTRPLFLVCFLLLTGLFVFNSYADEVTIDWKGGSYTGEVFNGVPDGQGVWDRTNGKYVGEFKDGLPNGDGTWTSADGEKYVGEFKDDEEWEGTEYDKDGNITATYSEGVKTEK